MLLERPGNKHATIRAGAFDRVAWAQKRIPMSLMAVGLTVWSRFGLPQSFRRCGRLFGERFQTFRHIGKLDGRCGTGRWASLRRRLVECLSRPIRPTARRTANRALKIHSAVCPGHKAGRKLHRQTFGLHIRFVTRFPASPDIPATLRCAYRTASPGQSPARLIRHVKNASPVQSITSFPFRPVSTAQRLEWSRLTDERKRQ